MRNEQQQRDFRRENIKTAHLHTVCLKNANDS